ncbi:hypothetical protein F53441_641 [Fusarium austroafricanum]|uniref:Uncharacterized protein n=1 Tax=Fusarium austroafricanum TaxID=2364996 RepID=A0A8H4NZX1_9HYPO|nr:hypothetical protein F53441_641 [Fusarium austroafricanum]
MPGITSVVSEYHVLWMCHAYLDPDNGIWCNNINAMNQGRFCHRCGLERSIGTSALNMTHEPLGTLYEIINGMEFWEYHTDGSTFVHNHVGQGADQSPNDSHSVSATSTDPDASSSPVPDDASQPMEIINGLDNADDNSSSTYEDYEHKALDNVEGLDHTAESEYNNGVNGYAGENERAETHE